jgi:glycosyltransferase involved in cell wall biosynthesis
VASDRPPETDAPAPAARRVAYLVNAYPATSHSFIRREIQALEAHGLEVLRYSVRPTEGTLVSPEDEAERGRTQVLLDRGARGLLGALLATAATRPAAFLRAAAETVRLGWRSERGLLRHLAYLAEACLLARLLRQAGASHLHAHFGTNPAAVALLCRRLGGPPYSFTVHGPEEFDKAGPLGLRRKAAGAAFVVAVSRFGRSQLWRWLDLADWPKVRVIRCGLGPDLLQAAPSAVPAEPRLVCVARLSEQKGLMVLVEAAARLAAEGERFEVVLVGDGPLRGELERAVRGAGLDDRLRLEGWRSGEEVRRTILASRAMVLPSFAEGLPVVLMEALALGRPVISTWVAGIPELVVPAVNGWLVPAGCAESLATAMRAALHADPAALETMGRAGAALVARQHDASQEAARLAACFGEAAGD